MTKSKILSLLSLDSLCSQVKLAGWKGTCILILQAFINCNAFLKKKKQKQWVYVIFEPKQIKAENEHGKDSTEIDWKEHEIDMIEQDLFFSFWFYWDVIDIQLYKFNVVTT